MVKKYYAVKKGRHPGIYKTWTECQKEVNGYPNAKFKSFLTLEGANEWLQTTGNTVTSTKAVNYSDDILVYTDGGCSGNPGPGGWACVIIAEGQARQLSGGEKLTTNNKMELMAAISALSAIKNTARFQGIPVEVNIDSQYVKNGITQWIFSWKKKGWKKGDGAPALNVDLWEEILQLLSVHKVSFVWVKGHDGHAYNERCDKLATDFADSFPH